MPNPFLACYAHTHAASDDPLSDRMAVYQMTLFLESTKPLFGPNATSTMKKAACEAALSRIVAHCLDVFSP